MILSRIAIVIGLAAITGTAGAQSAQRQTYIVQLADSPVASYAGTVGGYPATKPAPGARLNVDASTVRAYIGYLEAQRNNVLATIPGADIVHKYSVAFNGFAAKLTPAQARKLRATAGVVAVSEDEVRTLDTTRTPAFIGLSTAGGLWSQLDGAARNVKGENVIIGMVDGGVWPENPSFSDKVDAGTGKPVPYFQPGVQVYGPPPAQWSGTCQPGQGFTTAMCNNKLIGARFFNSGFVASGLVLWPTDYVGPRDEDGHGSHTMSTAGGNENVDALVFGSSVGAMSGIAPRARVAMYRVCYSYVDTNGSRHAPTCFTSDSVAAIDQAVADGVDVINFSISGTKTNYLDPVEVAFFFAADAGVFVAASAGNEGPGNQVAHMSPWLATVAASTHDRFLVAPVTLGAPSGATFSGPSYQTGVSSTPLIRSIDAIVGIYASLPQAEKTAAERCYLPADGGTANTALDPVKAAGKMVICYRGGNVLVNKAATVRAGGGVAMLLQNVPAIGGTPASANTTVLQPYVVPTVHLTADTYATINSYVLAQGPAATASFGPGVQQPGVVAPVMASFSSRGPSLANANILKPDISGPGVDIFAAFVADNSDEQAVHDAIVAGANGDPNAASLQGTSMSSPHVAGAAALLKQLHPNWSPAAIKSALMTSTNDIKLSNGSLDPNRFGYGAGHLNPTPAASPALVYDAGTADYLRFLCGIGALAASGGTCSAVGSISPWNLNLASITAAEAAGKITLRRTVTNVTSSTRTFTASASLAGWTVVVDPASLTLASGASGSFDVKLTRTTAAVGTWAFGSLVWSDGVTQVRSPLSAKGILFASPSLVADARAAGTKVFTVGTGYDGTLSATPTGMVPATRFSSVITTGDFQCFDVVVPAGALHARFQLFNADTQGGSASDLDLYVYRGATQVGASGGSTADELVDLPAPTPATYSACVDGYSPLGGSAAYTLSTWVVGPAVGTQTLRIAVPSRVYLGGTASVGTSWSVATGNRYLGIVQFRDGASTALGSTLVSVDVH